MSGAFKLRRFLRAAPSGGGYVPPVGGVTGGAGSGGGSGSVINITDANDLYAKLNAPGTYGGHILQLPANTDLGTFYTPATDFTSNPITVLGQTGSTFTILGVYCKGVRFKNFTVSGGPGETFAIGPGTGAAYVTFENVIANSGAADGTPSSTQGWQIRNADNIMLIGARNNAINDIFGFGNSMSIIDSTNITVTGLTVKNNGTDGILFTGTTNLYLEGLLGYEFHGDIAGGDHPDWIQGFGNSATILIKNCGWMRNTGGESQGYFFEDCDGITVQSCWLYGGMLNSVAIARGDTALFDDNYLVGYADYGSEVIVRGAYANATVTNNYVGSISNYAADGVNPNFVPASGNGSNTLIGTVTPGDFTGLGAWLSTHTNARGHI